MPQPRQLSVWPSAGERRTRCTLQYAVSSTDSMGGTSATSWVDFGTWMARVTIDPKIPNQTEAVLLYDVEGPFRTDLIIKFLGGVTLRIVAVMQGISVTLTVLQVQNPLLANRTLIAHCAAVTA